MAEHLERLPQLRQAFRDTHAHALAAMYRGDLTVSSEAVDGERAILDEFLRLVSEN